jgi:predicted CoA-binding protein
MNLATTPTESDDIGHILATCRTVAVVGLSPKPHRDSFRVAQYLQAQGWRIVPVNPVVASSGESILGEQVFASLSLAAQAHAIDLVDVFRNSDEVPPIVEEAIALKLPALWLQLGVRHDAALDKARAAGLRVVQDRCLKVEYAHYLAAIIPPL